LISFLDGNPEEKSLPLKVKPIQKIILFVFFPFFFFVLPEGTGFPCPQKDIGKIQSTLGGKNIGERIAFWAGYFIGTPYDEDPQGLYVTKGTIVADEKIDCMYHIFRSAELALSQTPEEAVQIALEKRFHSRGQLENGRVINYQDRFQYGEDMIESGKWGKEVTAAIGPTHRIQGSRGKEFFEVLPPQGLWKGKERLKTGDLFFFMTFPEKRKVGEAVGHIGVVTMEGPSPDLKLFLIHASGTKKRGGSVKKVLLEEYLKQMPFVGVRITRFEE
jgi:hypothetical protein